MSGSGRGAARLRERGRRPRHGQRLPGRRASPRRRHARGLDRGPRRPALAGLLREALEAVLPDDVGDLGRRPRGAPRAPEGGRACPSPQRRPLLLEALNRLYAERAPGRGAGMSGFVSLVGAGPGDPELLTVRAARAPARRPTSSSTTPSSRREVLALAPRAQRFSRRQARAAAPRMRQETIHALHDPRRAARQAGRAPEGRRPVRVRPRRRGGARAGARPASPFEVVPGVTQRRRRARRSPGIPVTHRGLASAFVVVSGHAESAWRPVLEAWRRAPRTRRRPDGPRARARAIARLPAGARLAPRAPRGDPLRRLDTPARPRGSAPLGALGAASPAGPSDAAGDDRRRRRRVALADVARRASPVAQTAERQEETRHARSRDAHDARPRAPLVRGRGRDRRVRAAPSSATSAAS